LSYIGQLAAERQQLSEILEIDECDAELEPLNLMKKSQRLTSH
jgi:hypothetical protein